MNGKFTSPVDLDEMVRFYGLQVGRSNARVLAVLCVFHQEKTPSLTMWRQSQRFHCFGCQKGGSVQELIQFLDGTSASDGDRLWRFQPVSKDQLELPLVFHERPFPEPPEPWMPF